MELYREIGNTVQNWLIAYGGRLLLSALFALVALIALHFLRRILKKVLTRAGVNDKIITVATTFLRILFYTVIGFVILDAFHIPITALVAFLSAVGLALSLAFKETLANFAQGVLLLILRPFRLGDVIEADGVVGTVQSIEIFYTRILTADRRLILIPNRQMTDTKIINYTAEKIRRLDMPFYLPAGEDTMAAKKVILSMLPTYSKALQEPKPSVLVTEQKLAYQEITLRVYTLSGNDYFDLRSALLEDIPKELQQEGISLARPMQEIHLLPKE